MLERNKNKKKTPRVFNINKLIIISHALHTGRAVPRIKIYRRIIQTIN